MVNHREVLTCNRSNAWTAAIFFHFLSFSAAVTSWNRHVILYLKWLTSERKRLRGWQVNSSFNCCLFLLLFYCSSELFLPVNEHVSYSCRDTVIPGARARLLLQCSLVLLWLTGWQQIPVSSCLVNDLDQKNCSTGNEEAVNKRPDRLTDSVVHFYASKKQLANRSEQDLNRDRYEFILVIAWAYGNILLLMPWHWQTRDAIIHVEDLPTVTIPFLCRDTKEIV